MTTEQVSSSTSNHRCQCAVANKARCLSMSTIFGCFGTPIAIAGCVTTKSTPLIYTALGSGGITVICGAHIYESCHTCVSRTDEYLINVQDQDNSSSINLLTKYLMAVQYGVNSAFGCCQKDGLVDPGVTYRGLAIPLQTVGAALIQPAVLDNNPHGAVSATGITHLSPPPGYAFTHAIE